MTEILHSKDNDAVCACGPPCDYCSQDGANWRCKFQGICAHQRPCNIAFVYNQDEPQIDYSILRCTCQELSGGVSVCPVHGTNFEPTR